jgi:cell division protein FtsA
VRHSVVVPVGGDHFTNDIAVGLRTTIPEAERLKNEQGCAMSSMIDPETMLDVNGMGSRQQRTISQQMLSDILQPRAEEIIHFMRSEIRGAGYERQVGAGVVLTGGGAKLKGFAELAEEILDLPVRLAGTAKFGKAPVERLQQLQGPEFATVSGLVLYGDRRRRTHDFHDNSKSGFKKLFSMVRSFV